MRLRMVKSEYADNLYVFNASKLDVYVEFLGEWYWSVDVYYGKGFIKIEPNYGYKTLKAAKKAVKYFLDNYC